MCIGRWRDKGFSSTPLSQIWHYWIWFSFSMIMFSPLNCFDFFFFNRWHFDWHKNASLCNIISVCLASHGRNYFTYSKTFQFYFSAWSLKLCVVTIPIKILTDSMFTDILVNCFSLVLVVFLSHDSSNLGIVGVGILNSYIKHLIVLCA